MKQFLLLPAFLLLSTFASFAETIATDGFQVEVLERADGLNAPWAVAVISDREFLVTERDGILWHFKDGKRQEVSGVPEVWAEGQGGLLDIVRTTRFAQTREVLITYSEPVGNGARTALASAKLSMDGSRLTDFEQLFAQPKASSGGRHFGSRVVEDTNGELFVTVGDRGQADLAQDPNRTNGKIIRILGAQQWEIYSSGHRNPQGATLDRNGELWTVEHGAKGGDEINKPIEGRNYGWPIISYGTHYDGRKIGLGQKANGFEQPIFYWDPSIAPSGMMIYSGKLFPEWRGDIFIGSLKFDMISRLETDGSQVKEAERLFQGKFGRIRDIREAPDGSIWFLSVGDGALYQIKPAK